MLKSLTNSCNIFNAKPKKMPKTRVIGDQCNALD